MINIKLEKGYTFSPKDLKLYKEVNNNQERFPEIYNPNKKWNHDQKLINLSDINIPKYMNQKARDGNNPVRGEMEIDINNKGFSLDGLSIVLRPVGNKYEPIDGVTKLNIFNDKDVVNAPVTIIDNISEADALKLSIQLNLKDKPYGKANLDDIKKVVKQLFAIGDVKANGKTLPDSIGDAIIEMAGTHIPEGKIFALITEIEEDLTGVSNLISLTPKTAKQRIEELGYISDKQTVYVPVASFYEKAVPHAINQYQKYVVNNPDVEIRLVVYTGNINPKDPERDWDIKCKNFKTAFDEYLTNISKYFFDGAYPLDDKIKMFAAIPQVKNYKGVNFNDLYKF